jgi:hypothetical protein
LSGGKNPYAIVVGETGTGFFSRKIKFAVTKGMLETHVRLAKELSHDASKALHLPTLRTALGYRVAYAEALGAGLTAVEMQDPTARDEVVALAVEVKRMLR